MENRDEELEVLKKNFKDVKQIPITGKELKYSEWERYYNVDGYGLGVFNRYWAIHRKSNYEVIDRNSECYRTNTIEEMVKIIKALKKTNDFKFKNKLSKVKESIDNLNSVISDLKQEMRQIIKENKKYLKMVERYRA